jgi:hypothetical protein
MTREESLDSTHLAVERMHSEILENADIDVDPDGTEALLTHSQDMIDRLKAMPLGNGDAARRYAARTAVRAASGPSQRHLLRRLGDAT